MRLSIHTYLEARDYALFSQCQHGAWHEVLSSFKDIWCFLILNFVADMLYKKLVIVKM